MQARDIVNFHYRRFPGKHPLPGEHPVACFDCMNGKRPLPGKRPVAACMESAKDRCLQFNTASAQAACSAR